MIIHQFEAKKSLKCSQSSEEASDDLFYNPEINTKNYRKLLDLVRDRQVNIIFEISLPRSNSTAWQIAMTEAPEIHGQINEPSFHPGYTSHRHDEDMKGKPNIRNFDEYCARILERIEGNVAKNKVGLLHQIKNRPIGLIVNDITDALTTVEIKAILQLTNRIAITVRDARIQALSGLTRFMNDQLIAFGSANLSSKEALLLANQQSFSDENVKNFISSGKIDPNWILSRYPNQPVVTPLILKEAIDVAINDCLSKHIDICWDNLNHHVATIRKIRPDAKLAIIDGTDLTTDPNSIMHQSCDALGVTFTPNMIQGWQKSNKENFYCCITEGLGEVEARKNGWNGPVRNSTGLEKKPESIMKYPEVFEFPVVMQPKLQIALEIYHQLACSKDRIKPFIASDEKPLRRSKRIAATQAKPRYK